MASLSSQYHEPELRNRWSLRDNRKESAADQDPMIDDSYVAATNASAVPVPHPSKSHSSQQNLDTLLQAVTVASPQNRVQHLGSDAQAALPHNKVRDEPSKLAKEAISLVHEPGKGKRKRSPRSAGHQAAVVATADSIDPHLSHVKATNTRKRQKRGDSLQFESINFDSVSREGTHGSPASPNNQEADNSQADFLINEYPAQYHLDSARAPGVFSTAALFRKPSASSKRYTRPPMNKIFASLELAPENFLHLQSLAKAYMLDTSHPERKACIGSRGKGDTDIVKLRLSRCVEDFLNHDSIGERYFGAGADGADTRPFKWPENAERIISIVTPLLRRMLTNERQRQYAVESRKPGALDGRSTPRRSMSALDVSMAESMDSRFDMSFGTNLASSTENHNTTNQGSPLEVHVYLLGLEGKLLAPKNVLDTAQVQSLEAVAQFTDSTLESLHSSQLTRPSLFLRRDIKALLSTGLHGLNCNEDFTKALKVAKDSIWMEGVLKVIVECAEAPG